MAGNDLREMSQATRDILLNKEVIAIDQDPLGKQGTRTRRAGSLEVWTRPLADGGRAVLLFNRGATPAPIAVTWKELGLAKAPAGIRDLWAHADVSPGARLESTVPAHGVAMFRVK
jgi:alpha-galactosidase